MSPYMYYFRVSVRVLKIALKSRSDSRESGKTSRDVFEKSAFPLCVTAGCVNKPSCDGHRDVMPLFCLKHKCYMRYPLKCPHTLRLQKKKKSCSSKENCAWREVEQRLFQLRLDAILKTAGIQNKTFYIVNMLKLKAQKREYTNKLNLFYVRLDHK